ncbi:MAG: hypothetical protein J6Y75_07205 [Spirochaetaceae bacterium]|nr:hypothetical protein [Spirochaetaceae bacterium]MBP5329671.1 hypothetical protein [Spirochaetaceae bacterium]
MSKKRIPEIIIILLLIIISLCGILSLDFSKVYSYINQYGDEVKLFGSGIYKDDSYFKAPIFIGTDLCVLFFGVPLFIISLIKDFRNSTENTQLRLVSIEAISLYYAVSLCFGVKYNRIFVLYVILFSLLFFTLIKRMRNLSRYNYSFEMKKSDTAFLIFSGISLCLAWWPDIIPTIINKTSLKLIENYTTEPTYVLDLGIISPLCFISLILMKKKDSFGVVLYAILLQSIMIVAVMMICQSAVQFASGVEIPLSALISKSIIFIILGLFAIALDRRRSHNK